MKNLILPECLRKVIFAVVPLNGYNSGDLSALLKSGIENAREIGLQIDEDLDLTGEVQIFASETAFFSVFAGVLASHCQDKWLMPDFPYFTISNEDLDGILEDSDAGDSSRFKFLERLLPKSGKSEHIVLVVSEAQGLVLPRALCQFTDIFYGDQQRNECALHFRSITVNVKSKKVNFVVNEDADW